MAKSNYVVQRSTTINADPDRIYHQVADFHEWPKWSPWEDLDPQMQRTYSGPQAGTGATYAWEGNTKVAELRRRIRVFSLSLRVPLVTKRFTIRLSLRK